MDTTFEIEIYNQYGLEEKKYTICPICSHSRKPKNQKLKVLINNWEKGYGTCQHCKNVIQLHKYRFSKDQVYFIPQPKKKEVIKGSFHTLEELDKLMFKHSNVIDNFSLYLENFFDRRQIFEAEKELLVFNTNDFYQRSICYPYINEKEQTTGIKIMAYDSEGKRMRNEQGSGIVNWMHCLLKKENWINDFCLFGLHQIIERKEKAVHIVESEKTCYVMTIVKPEFIWMASGGLTMLNKKKLEPLKNHKIFLHPDKGKAFNEWLRIAEHCEGLNISVSRITEDNPELTEGQDLADYYLQEKFKIK
jgi:hypothetical protein